MRDRGDDAGSSVSGRGDDASTGSVFFIDGDGEDVEPIHGAQGIEELALEEFAHQARGAAAHVETAGEGAFRFETAAGAILHRLPDTGDVGADFGFGMPGRFVFQYEIGDAQVRASALV